MSDRDDASMTSKQNRVRVGVAAGAVYLALVVWAGGWLVQLPPVPAAGRLAFALPWLMLPGLMVLVGVVRVGMVRFDDPRLIDGGPPPAASPTDIDRRYVQNTVEQFLIFAPGWLALAGLLPDARLGLVPALAASFVVARIAFWWGYHRVPTGRAFGFAATMMANVVVYAWALTLWIAG